MLLVFAGMFVIAKAARALGSGLTPYPAPAENGELAEAGPFAVVRHPIYSGGILFAAGIALALSPWALAGTAALALVWALKATVEERFLAAQVSRICRLLHTHSIPPGAVRLLGARRGSASSQILVAQTPP